MKIATKESVQARITRETYNIVRRAAFKRHVPMTQIIEELVKEHAKSLLEKK